MARCTARMGHPVLYDFSYSTGSYTVDTASRKAGIQCYDNNDIVADIR